MVDRLFHGHVTWDRRVDDRIGVFHPAHIMVLRTHFDGLLKIASRRLQQHTSGEKLDLPGCRIEAICRRRSEAQTLTEFELVLGIANRAKQALRISHNDPGLE